MKLGTFLLAPYMAYRVSFWVTLIIGESKNWWEKREEEGLSGLFRALDEARSEKVDWVKPSFVGLPKLRR